MDVGLRLPGGPVDPAALAMAAATLDERWAAGDREAARAAVTDALGVAGTPETPGERFREVASLDVVDEPLCVVAGRADAEHVERTVEAVAPDG